MSLNMGAFSGSIEVCVYLTANQAVGQREIITLNYKQQRDEFVFLRAECIFVIVFGGNLKSFLNNMTTKNDLLLCYYI